MRLSKLDVIAATFRNAIFDVSTLNIFDVEDRPYEQFDAVILERCYQALDNMPADKINLYGKAIEYGFEIQYDRDHEDFIVVM
jgi:hypothetical protein